MMKKIKPDNSKNHLPFDYVAKTAVLLRAGIGGIYDGDGKRVQSTVGGVTTTFVGSHYEVTGSTVTKYYFAGTSRVAMRKYTIPQSMSVEYLLGDHLGSTSITTDTTGAKVSEMRYKPWGEVRYSWTAGLSTTPAYKLNSYTFTGQYSHMDDPSTTGVTEGFGLLFYNARMYDPQLGRFTSADSIVPGGVQGLDRYAYVNNSPIRYTDPSGHCPEDDAGCRARLSDTLPGAVHLNHRAKQLIDFSKSVGMTPEDVIGIGLGHEMSGETADEQKIHRQVFYNGFFDYARNNCSGNSSYNCMLNYFAGSYESVYNQFLDRDTDYTTHTKFWGHRNDYVFAQAEGNLSLGNQVIVKSAENFMKDFMKNIPTSYDPANNEKDALLPRDSGIYSVLDINALLRVNPDVASGFLIKRLAVCPRSGATGWSIVTNWYAFKAIDNAHLSLC